LSCTLSEIFSFSLFMMLSIVFFRRARLALCQPLTRGTPVVDLQISQAQVGVAATSLAERCDRRGRGVGYGMNVAGCASANHLQASTEAIRGKRTDQKIRLS
jgi:hypothetical protein